MMLLIALFSQSRSHKYVPAIYWLAVVLISVAGTLISDNLVQTLGVPFWVTTVVFAVVLCLAFIAWYMVEKSLSVHTIKTTRRELFYWTAILFTFTLGTAGGDLLSQPKSDGGLGLGTVVTSVAFLVVIVGLVTFRSHRLNDPARAAAR